MVNIQDLSSTVITLFIIVIVGYITTKAKMIDEVFTKRLSNFIICIAQPFMIVGALVQVEFSLENLKTGFTITGLGFCSLVICAGIAFLAVRWFAKSDEKKLGQFALIFANTGFMGFPVLKALFGDMGTFYAAFFVITFHVTLWTYGIFILSRGRSDIKIKPLNMFFNFGTVPVLIGIVLFMLPFDLPYAVTRAFDMMGDLCAPCAMVIVGSIVASVPLKSLFLDGKLYYICALRLLVLPAVICCLGTLVGLPDQYVYLFVTFTALPTATNCAMYAQKYDISPGFGAKISSMTTLLSIGTIPLMLYFTKFILSLRA